MHLKLREISIELLIPTRIQIAADHEHKPRKSEMYDHSIKERLTSSNEESNRRRNHTFFRLNAFHWT